MGVSYDKQVIYGFLLKQDQLEKILSCSICDDENWFDDNEEQLQKIFPGFDFGHDYDYYSGYYDDSLCVGIEPHDDFLDKTDEFKQKIRDLVKILENYDIHYDLQKDVHLYRMIGVW